MWVWVELIGLGGRLSIEKFKTVTEARLYIINDIVPAMEPDDTVKMFEANEHGE